MTRNLIDSTLTSFSSNDKNTFSSPIEEFLSCVYCSDHMFFGCKDNLGQSLDCIKVFEVGNKVYGLYHHLKDKDFCLHLAICSDGLTKNNWKHLK